MHRNTWVGLASSLSAIALLAPGSAGALDIGGWEVGIQPRLETGVVYYSYDQDSVVQLNVNPEVAPGAIFSASFSDLKFNDILPTISGGLTLFVNRFFIDGTAQYSFNGSDGDTENIFVFGEFPTAGGGDPSGAFALAQERSSDIDFDRVEYAVSAGYAITDTWTVYAGYKSARTDADIDYSSDLRLDAFPANQPPIISDPRFTGTLEEKVDFEFEQHGPFIGTSYGWNIKQGFLEGLLSANIAVAFLKGKLKTDIKQSTFTSVQGGVESGGTIGRLRESDGDTVGITFGLAWKGLTPIENLTYSLSASGYQYTYSSDNTIEDPDITETLMSFRIGVGYSF